MTRIEKIEAVTFDAAGTLFFPYPSVGSIYQEVLAKHGLALESSCLEKAFHQAFQQTRKDPSIADPERRERAYWKEVVSQSVQSLAPFPTNFDEIFDLLWQTFAEGSRWKLNEDAVELFDFLESQNIPFALLTNWDRRVRSVIRDHHLDQRFSRVFVSSEIGFEKPDPRIFQFAAEALGVSANRILHIGDHYEQDALGARSAGWLALQFVPNGSALDAENPSIRRLKDVRQLIAP